MRKLLKIFLWLLVSAVAAFAILLAIGWYGSYLWYRVRSRYERREVMVPMRDGVRLHTIILEPKDTCRSHPIMIERTCYGADVDALVLDDFAPYVDASYILVFQDVRGRNGSEGDFEDIRPFIECKSGSHVTDEASDAYDTVEWLLGNVGNHNGRVGVKGISYPGFYATMAALSAHPAIKAVSPQAPVGDWFIGDDCHHNGAFMLGETVPFVLKFEYGNNPAYADSEEAKDRATWHIEDNMYSHYLKMGTYRSVLDVVGPERFFLDTLRVHPDYDRFWKSHSVLDGHLHDVRPAVMVVGGLFDKEDCYGALETYKRMHGDSPSTELYLVMGPWYHGAWVSHVRRWWGTMYFGRKSTARYFMRSIEYPFFAWYLEGKGEKPSYGAMVFDSGTRDVNEYDVWPEVPVSEATPFYLLPSGKVSIDRPTDEGRVSYVSDPGNPVPYRADVGTRVDRLYMIDDQRFASARDDVASFESDVLAEDMALHGEIEVELYVDISTTDADFVVKVIDVYPDDFSWREEAGAITWDDDSMRGYELMVRGEVFRGKYRRDFSAPVPFVPGRTDCVRFRMPDISHTIRRGHRLKIQVQSSWFPLVDRNPQTFCNIYECDGEAYVVSEIGIHCGGSSASCVRLPLVR